MDVTNAPPTSPNRGVFRGGVVTRKAEHSNYRRCMTEVANLSKRVTYLPLDHLKYTTDAICVSR